VTARGFTLIETLVALLVVAVAYAGVATAMSQFVDQRLMLVERHASHRIAWNRLMEQYLLSRHIEVEEADFAESKGSVERLGQRWHWQLTEEKAAGENLVRYQVDVYSDSPKLSDKSPPQGTLAAFFIR
jgi:type II secretion system protein I